MLNEDPNHDNRPLTFQHKRKNADFEVIEEFNYSGFFYSFKQRRQ